MATHSDPSAVSVVTVVRNGSKGLRATLESVASQSYPHIEHIVIDGGSSDGTLDVIAEFADRLAYWVSEPDRGISDAFNKGIAVAKGGWLNFLNAADTFASERTVERVASRFPGERIVTGFAQFGDELLPCRRLGNDERLTRRALISHQASFIHRSVIEECGGFDLDFAVRMDYELWLRALRHHRFLFLGEVLVRYEPGGLSSRSRRLFLREEMRANRKNLRRYRLANLHGWVRHHTNGVPGTRSLGVLWRRLRWGNEDAVLSEGPTSAGTAPARTIPSRCTRRETGSEATQWDRRAGRRDREGSA